MILTLLLLTSFFVGSVLFRKLSIVKLCAICSAVSLTWLVLLSIYLTRGDTDPLILGILMGGSAVGVMYYLSSKLSEKYQLLRFPFLISLFWVIYQVIRTGGPVIQELLIIVGMWIVFGTIFLFYQNNRLKEIGKRLIECCKNW